MYSTCLYCHTDLGKNEVIEHFPVGRRLAFDLANGRFWVTCRSCKRWNLSPLEERWDAMDECERLFERTRLRMSTDNIGLARLAEGTELVRVGAALRPEMAAWRFGAQLAARRRYYRWLVAGGVVAAAGIYVGMKTAGFGIIAGTYAWRGVKRAYERVTRLVLPVPASVEPGARRVRGSAYRTLAGASNRSVESSPRVESKHAKDARLALPVDEPVRLTVPVVGGLTARYFGDDAIRIAPKLLAKVNKSGGRPEDERLAVEMLEQAAGQRDPDLFTAVMRRYAAVTSLTKPFKDYGTPLTLALEMALHEQRERELLAGELLDLEFAWKEAEELARIADTLVPSHIDQALARLKARIES